ncbi:MULTISPECIES: Ldh family oxidoreductase [Microbacterium]|uniref:Ldh family oxidoreductase n=1 Tax=Microbacterium TaxID=33882 RepID=UPI001430F10B|nr:MULTISPECIES: Ldh family oxidoreductase [Microbacterium]MCK6065447.1 Ldh family oxidoreductase [Microbacterium sp. EYE_512]
MSTGSVILDAESLRKWAHGLLESLGAPEQTAATVSQSLVEADLRGHDSHGVRRIAPYADFIRQGRLDPAAVPSVIEAPAPAVARVDGANAFGQLTARLGAGEAATRAGRYGVGAAVLSRCQHVGRLGEYVERIAEQGLVGFALANADPTVAAWGGRTRLLGTNPLAWAVPAGRGAAPVVVDFATSATAEGKLAVAVANGATIPEGLVLDANGRGTTDPGDFYAGGSLLPFGGHKGYGLGLIADVVGGLLSRTGSASSPSYDGTFGTVLIALDVAAFVDADEFSAEVEALRARVHGSEPADGSQGVLVPGEPEWDTRRQRLATGITIAPGTVEALDRLATEQDLTPLSDLNEENRT